MLFLSRQEVNNIMTRVAKVEECQRELAKHDNMLQDIQTTTIDVNVWNYL